MPVAGKLVSWPVSSMCVDEAPFTGCALCVEHSFEQGKGAYRDAYHECGAQLIVSSDMA